MQWELAHRPRDTYDATAVSLTASSSQDAIQQLRERIPAGDLVLYVCAAQPASS